MVQQSITPARSSPPPAAPHRSQPSGTAGRKEITLEQALAKTERRRGWPGKLAPWLVLALLVMSAVVWRVRAREAPLPRYVPAAVTIGDVLESVQSTGTVQPLTQVQVGAQISGRITKVYVDFNAEVRRGDVLAEIDTTLLGATVEQNRAQLASAQAQLARSEASLTTAEATLARLQRLHTENLATEADVDQALGQRDVAMADVAAAKAQIVQTKAQLVYSKTNFKYCQIYAPIDGLVISRNIDPGQTVAASYQAPTLFVIAQDMRKMRILAEIDEADVGKLKEGMAAEATVDAFAGDRFHGTVNQVRYNPNMVQGVVTYLAVVDVDNPDLKLRPGMTATVIVRTRHAKGVVRIPNAALRFGPSQVKPGLESRVPKVPADTRLAFGKGRVHRLTDPTPGRERIEAEIVDIGITDGVNTELKSTDLPPGTLLVIDETDPSDDRKKGLRIF